METIEKYVIIEQTFHGMRIVSESYDSEEIISVLTTFKHKNKNVYYFLWKVIELQIEDEIWTRME